MKNLFAGKRIGFYATLVLAVLAIVTAVIYAVDYSKYASMSWNIVAILAVGAVAAAVLALIGKGFWAPWVQFAAALIPVLLFITTQYSYVAVVMVGIDLKTFNTRFIVCSVLLVVNLIGSIVNIYLKQEEK